MDEVLVRLTEVVSNFDYYTELFLQNLGVMGAIISCALITIESILPVLPICVFITLVFLTFGSILGFIISWIFTCLGCIISFALFRSKIKAWFEKKFVKKGSKIKDLMKYIDKMSLSSLTILIAIPFTPASVVNIAAGLSNMKFKKFLYAILIGKLFMVYFWGYIGTTLIECFTHPIYIVRILLMLLFAYVISRFVNKKFNIE